MKKLSSDIKALLDSVASGDELSFSKLFDQYRNNIFSTAVKLTGDEEIAEEIVQDTFLKVWLHRESLPKILNFDGWLYTIARNLIFNSMKRDKREKENLQKSIKESLLSIYQAEVYEEMDQEFHDILSKAIQRLPQKQKETFKLIKEENLKRKEVADRLNVSPETVKWNLDQALKNVRAYCLSNMKELPLIIVLYLKSKYF